MKIRIILFLCLIILPGLNILSQIPDSIKLKDKVALVIGNGNYASKMLANPENDAKAIGDVLRKLGFIVSVETNIDQKQMKKAIDDFGLDLKDAKVALFYYAGHGVQHRGLNYLVPIDAEIISEAQIEYDCVQADRVLTAMEESGVKIKIMILDACRNNPFEKSWTRSAASSGLAVMTAANNTFIAYATAPGSTASDGSGNNSLYTSALLESIILPDLSIDQVFQVVGKKVTASSMNVQFPWKSSSLTDDFYFNREATDNSGIIGADYYMDPRDNKNYKIVKIGTQVWMKNNLNYLSFNNGDSIPELRDLSSWSSSTSPATCVYKNRLAYASTYGRLYNFYAASDVRNLCPAGWHVPTIDDWRLLESELGGSLIAGGKMKEQGTGNWVPPNASATDESGFTAQPFGSREDRTDYCNLGSYAGFYSREGFVTFLTSESVSLAEDSTGSFTTGHSIRCIKGREPLSETDPASNVTSSSVTLNGKVNPNLAPAIVTFEYGTSTEYGLSATAKENPVVGSVPSNVSVVLTGLKPGTKYHFRVKAESVGRIVFGSDKTVETLVLPVVTTDSATLITAHTAWLNGLVNPNNSQTTVTFDYGTTPEYGQTVIASLSPASGLETVSMNYWISGLREKTLYHYRIKAESDAGTAEGKDLTFTTPPLPVVKTDSATAIGSTSATLNCSVSTTNMSTSLVFEYGTTEDYGSTFNAADIIMTTSSARSFNIPLKDLKPGTTYHFRVKASNTAGTVTGNDLIFSTPEVLKDNSGNTYNTLSIAKQVWMAENLRTTKYSDGTDIPHVTSARGWSKLKTPGYCWYNNDTASNKSTYGVLYNWYTVYTFRLCPSGWHVPDEEEWNILIDYLGESSLAGIKLKEEGTTHWQKPGTGATNASGFTALPGGSRDMKGLFVYNGLKGQWWCADDSTANTAWLRSMDFSNNGVTSFFNNKSEGSSVRCLKDEILPTIIIDSVSKDEVNYFIDPRDNKRYKTFMLGNKVWMAENLKATRFNDNTDIPQVIDKIAWTRLESPAFCWYENQEVYSTYGALYNWYTVTSNKLCPRGWNVPSEEDWKELTDACGGLEQAAGYLKESGTSHWNRPNEGYLSDNPFKALPGGLRDELGEFGDIGSRGYWWSYMKGYKPTGRYLTMYNSSSAVILKSLKSRPIGLSVRCVREKQPGARSGSSK
jgi:uncharacterized protein (TIGR02145 family)